MKKNQLIKMLQNIKGNPEIKLWNGMVGDWMNFELTEGVLVKECPEFIRWWVEADWKQNNKTEVIPEDVQKELDIIIANRIKNETWETPNPYLDGEKFKRWYGKNVKTTYFIDGKLRGKVCGDRIGNISY